MESPFKALLAAALLSAIPAWCSSAEESITGTASIAGITEISLELSSVSVEARVGGMELTLMREGIPSSISISMQRSGHSLRILQGKSLFGLVLGDSGKLVITLPQGTAMSAGTSSGAVSLAGLVSKRISFASSSGSMSLRDCGGSMDVRTSSGGISLERCAGPKKLESSSGGISVEGGSGTIDARCSSGGVSIRSITGDIKIETSSGGVNLAEVTGSMSIQTTSGGVSGTGIILMGSSTFATSSGDIAIALLNRAAQLRFDLSSSSGALEAAGSRGQRRLASGSGSITVTGVSTSGGQRFSTN